MSWHQDSNVQFAPGANELHFAPGQISVQVEFDGLYSHLRSTMPVIGDVWVIDGVALTVVDVTLRETPECTDVGRGAVTLADEAQVLVTAPQPQGRDMRLGFLPRFAALTRGEREYCWLAGHDQLGDGLVTGLIDPSPLQKELIALYGSGLDSRTMWFPEVVRTTSAILKPGQSLTVSSAPKLENPPKVVATIPGMYWVKAPYSTEPQSGIWRRAERWVTYLEAETPKILWE